MTYDETQVRQSNADKQAQIDGGLFAQPSTVTMSGLWPSLLSHRSDPWTSRAAAVAGQSTAASHRAMILTYLDRVGAPGATADEIDAHYGWTHLTAARRLSDLEKAGLVQCPGATRPSNTGNPARVYRTETTHGR